MTRFDPKAIVLALLLSLALDVTGSMVLLAAFGSGLRGDMTPEQAEAAIRAVSQQLGFQLTALAYGTFTTIAGGYAAARMAASHPYFNALAIGVLGIVLGLLMQSSAPGWFNALSYLGSMPAAVLGGHLARRRRP